MLPAVLVIVCEPTSSLSMLVGNLASVIVGILSILNVSLPILLALSVGILSAPNVSLVILLALSDGILSAPNVSLVILLALSDGILSAPNVSLVILLALSAGILSTPNVPLVILEAGRAGIALASKLSLALSNVPVVILAVSKLGMIVAFISVFNLALSILPLLAKSSKSICVPLILYVLPVDKFIPFWSILQASANCGLNIIGFWLVPVPVPLVCKTTPPKKPLSLSQPINKSLLPSKPTVNLVPPLPTAPPSCIIFIKALSNSLELSLSAFSVNTLSPVPPSIVSVLVIVWSAVSVLTMFVGNLASAIVPAVILEAFRLGILSSAKAPSVILDAGKSGICPTAKPPVISLKSTLTSLVIICLLPFNFKNLSAVSPPIVKVPVIVLLAVVVIILSASIPPTSISLDGLPTTIILPLLDVPKSKTAFLTSLTPLCRLPNSPAKSLYNCELVDLLTCDASILIPEALEIVLLFKSNGTPNVAEPPPVVNTTFSFSS